MKKEDLIRYYEKHLERVKQMHNPDRATTCLMKDKCNAYVEQAEKDLDEVKNGRQW